MGGAFVALKRGRGQGGDVGASLMGCDCGANAAPGLFSVQPEGLEALGPSFGVARSGKTHAGYCRFARALKYGPIASSECPSHLISGSLMANQELAAYYAKSKPNKTWEEVVKKYNGDYELIIKKSLETNKEINQLVEQLRQKH